MAEINLTGDSSSLVKAIEEAAKAFRDFDAATAKLTKETATLDKHGNALSRTLTLVDAKGRKATGTLTALADGTETLSVGFQEAAGVFTTFSQTLEANRRIIALANNAQAQLFTGIVSGNVAVQEQIAALERGKISLQGFITALETVIARRKAEDQAQRNSIQSNISNLKQVRLTVDAIANEVNSYSVLTDTILKNIAVKNKLSGTSAAFIANNNRELSSRETLRKAVDVGARAEADAAIIRVRAVRASGKATIEQAIATRKELQARQESVKEELKFKRVIEDTSKTVKENTATTQVATQETKEQTAAEKLLSEAIKLGNRVQLDSIAIKLNAIRHDEATKAVKESLTKTIIRERKEQEALNVARRASFAAGFRDRGVSGVPTRAQTPEAQIGDFGNIERLAPIESQVNALKRLRQTVQDTAGATAATVIGNRKAAEARIAHVRAIQALGKATIDQAISDRKEAQARQEAIKSELKFQRVIQKTAEAKEREAKESAEVAAALANEAKFQELLRSLVIKGASAQRDANAIKLRAIRRSAELQAAKQAENKTILQQIAVTQRLAAAQRSIVLGATPAVGPRAAPTGIGSATRAGRIDPNVLNRLKLIRQNITGASKDFGLFGARLETVNRPIDRLVAKIRLFGIDASRAAQKAAFGVSNVKNPLEVVNSGFIRLKESIASLGRLVGISLLIGGAFRLQQAFVDGTRAAIDFSKAIAEIQTIDVKNLGFDEWTQQLEKLSNAFGIPIIDQAEAAYQALSNQVVQGSETFGFLAAANELALTSVSETSEAVNLLTSAINAFGFDSEDSRQLSAKFFKTVELGRLRINELSDSFGRVAVPASQVGISIDELLASLATLTIQGVKANEAMTFIRNIVQKLIRPSDALKKLFAEIGVESGEAAIKTFGFGGFLKILQERTQGSTTELGELFQRIRAISGVLGFAGEGLENYTDNLRQIEGINLEDFGKKTELVLNNTGQVLKREAERIRNLFSVDIGQKVIEALAKASMAVGGFDNALKGLGVTLKFLAITATPLLLTQLGLLLKSLGALIVASKAFNIVLLKNPIIAIGTAAVAATALITDSIKETAKEAGKLANSISENTDKIFNKLVASERKITKELLEQSAIRNRSLRQNLSKLSGAINKALQENLRVVETTEIRFRLATRNILNSLGKQISAVTNAIKKSSREVSQFTDNIENSLNKISKQRFEFALEDASNQEQEGLIVQRIVKLQQEASKAIQSGDRDRFNNLQKEIEDLGKKRLEVAKKINQEEFSLEQRLSRARSNLRIANETFDPAARSKALRELRELSVIRKNSADLTKEELDLVIRQRNARLALRDAIREGAPREVILQLRTEVSLLRDEEKQVNDFLEEQKRLREEIINTEKRANEQRLQAIEAEKRKREEAEASFRELEGQKLTLQDLLASARKFNIEKVLEGNNFDEINKKLGDQANLFDKILLLNGKSLQSEDLRASIIARANAIQEAGTKRLQELRAQTSKAIVDSIEEGEKRELERINKTTQQQKRSFAALRAQLLELRNLTKEELEATVSLSSQRVGPEQEVFLQTFDFDTAFKKVDELTKSIEKDLEKAFKEGITSGLQFSIIRKSGELQKILDDLKRVPTDFSDVFKDLDRFLPVGGIAQRADQVLQLFRGVESALESVGTLTGRIADTQAARQRAIEHSQGRLSQFDFQGDIEGTRAPGLSQAAVEAGQSFREEATGSLVTDAMEAGRAFGVASGLRTPEEVAAETAAQAQAQATTGTVTVTEAATAQREAAEAQKENTHETIQSTSILRQNNALRRIRSAADTQAADKANALANGMEDVNAAAQLRASVDQRAASSVEELAQSAKRAAERIITFGAKTPGFATGGPVTHGPGGTDKILARLTKGEFVVNRNATKKFFPQLMAMNSGRVIPGFASGGMVNNVGGIRVNVDGSESPQSTARKVVAEINRGIRQGTLRFHGQRRFKK